MKCVRCGTELKLGDKVCLGCGFEVGKKYTEEPQNETLESLMQMKIETEKKIDEAEEMEIDDSIEQTEEINGEKITLENNIVKESTEKVKIKNKNKKIYIFLIILIIVIIIGTIIYLNFNKIKCHINKCNNIVEKPKEKPKEIINHPTTQYVFESTFIFKLNDLWKEKNEQNFSNQIEKIVFEKNESEFKIIKYRFPENKIQYYLNYIGIVTSNQIENNKTKYEHITNNQTEEYIVAKNEYIYVLSFTNLKTEEINGIMKTIYYYK